MFFFFFQWLTVIIAAVVHVLIDRHPDRRTKPRVVQLLLLWGLGGFGVWAIVGGLFHLGPSSDSIAEGIGYAQSEFQWEVGWADIAIGVLMLLGVFKRGRFMEAGVIAITISYGGDAIGHIKEWIVNDNTAVNNVWAIPSDILTPVLLIVLLYLHRKYSGVERDTGKFFAMHTKGEPQQ